MMNIQKEIYNYYWNELEENSNGYGDPYPLKKIEEKYSVILTWEQLLQIFRENGYKL